MFEGTTNVYFAGSKHFCALYKCFGAQDIFLRTIIYVYLILPHLDGHIKEENDIDNVWMLLFPAQEEE